MALVAVVHRNSGDVGAAADLAAARDVIAERTADGDDPFGAVDRGLFRSVRRVEVRAAGLEWLDAVELGEFAGDGSPALRLVLAASGVATGDEVTVQIESGANGLAVRWPHVDDRHALLQDLRSGAVYGEPAVEQVHGTVVIPLPAVFDAARSWTVEVRDPSAADACCTAPTEQARDQASDQASDRIAPMRTTMTTRSITISDVTR